MHCINFTNYLKNVNVIYHPILFGGILKEIIYTWETKENFQDIFRGKLQRRAACVIEKKNILE